MGELSFVSAWSGDWLVVHLVGALVRETVPEFTSRLGDVRGRRIRIDLAAVDDLDADGVGALRAARERFERMGRVLDVVPPP